MFFCMLSFFYWMIRLYKSCFVNCLDWMIRLCKSCLGCYKFFFICYSKRNKIESVFIIDL